MVKEYIIIHYGNFLKFIFKIEVHLVILLIVFIFSETSRWVLIFPGKLKIPRKILKIYVMLVSAYEKYRFSCILLHIYLNVIMYGNIEFLQCITCTDGTLK